MQQIGMQLAEMNRSGTMHFMSSAAIFTISDKRSQGAAEDISGPAASEIVESMGYVVAHRGIIPDEVAAIQEGIRTQINHVSLIVTTGGTGIAERDVTPEALVPLFDRELPGFGEIMRTGSYPKTPLSIISRGGAGVAGHTLIVMLPGSPGAVRDSLTLLAPAIRHIVKFLENLPVDCEHDSRQGA